MLKRVLSQKPNLVKSISKCIWPRNYPWTSTRSSTKLQKRRSMWLSEVERRRSSSLRKRSLSDHIQLSRYLKTTNKTRMSLPNKLMIEDYWLCKNTCKDLRGQSQSKVLLRQIGWVPNLLKINQELTWAVHQAYKKYKMTLDKKCKKERN